MRTLYEGLWARTAPEYLQRTMLMRGGTNIYGEPNYRLVWAPARKRLSGGTWTEWLTGTETRYRNPDINRAFKTVTEIRPIAMYPALQGWVLERWMPAQAYGSRDRWYSAELEGGTMKWIDGKYIPGCGTYPERGDYETTNFIFPEWALSDAMLAKIVGKIERRLDEVAPTNKEQRAREEMNAAFEEERLEDLQYTNWAEDILGEAIQDSPSLAARTPGGQAEMHRFAEKAGITSQLF